MNLMIVPGILVCSNLSDKSVYVYCVESFVHIESTVIVRTGGVIWLNPFATMLLNVCSTITVKCCVFYPCCMGVFGMFVCL